MIRARTAPRRWSSWTSSSRTRSGGSPGALAAWRRTPLQGAPAGGDEQPLMLFSGLGPGYYEARCALRSRRLQSVFFQVTPQGAIRILIADGREEEVLAWLNGMSLDELRAA